MLKGKIAVVTGGTRGIGRAICRRFAENGADIAFIYAGNTELAEGLEAELRTLGVRAAGYRVNIADYDAVAEVFKRLIADFGTVDILVNNAGITRDRLTLALRERDFDEVIGVNLKGAFNAIRQVYPVMMRKQSGRIINISSVAGLTGNPGQANYSASKAGLIGLTKTVAKELASRGVTCNAIAPGLIATDMTENISDDGAIARAIPAGRRGRPEEVAALALFLASPEAGYITGEVIRIDGGLAM